MIEMTTAEYRASLRQSTARYATSEAEEQMALIEWKGAMLGREPRLALLFHPANGELREKRVGAKLKRMGVVPGVPDLWLPVPSAGYVGLAIELKAIGGHTSPDQDWWLLELTRNGWYTAVRYGWLSAAKMIAWYLDIRESGLEDL